VYKRRRLDGPTPETLGEPSQAGESGSINSAAANVSFPFSGLSPFDVDFFDTPQITGGNDVGVIDSDEDNDIDPFMDFVNALGDGSEEDTSLWLTHGTNGGEAIERAGTPICEKVREGYENMAGGGLCVCFSLVSIFSFQFHLISLSVKS